MSKYNRGSIVKNSPAARQHEEVVESVMKGNTETQQPIETQAMQQTGMQMQTKKVLAEIPISDYTKLFAMKMARGKGATLTALLTEAVAEYVRNHAQNL